MNASTRATVSPVQRWTASTVQCTATRSGFTLAAMQRLLDERVGVRLLDLHRPVLRVQLDEHAPFLLGSALRHAAVAGEHRDLLLQRRQPRGAVGPGDLVRKERPDLV